jgi:hypothetical protein
MKLQFEIEHSLYSSVWRGALTLSTYKVVLLGCQVFTIFLSHNSRCIDFNFIHDFT